MQIGVVANQRREKNRASMRPKTAASRWHLGADRQQQDGVINGSKFARRAVPVGGQNRALRLTRWRWQRRLAVIGAARVSAQPAAT